MAHRVHRPHNFRALSKAKQIPKSQHHHYWPYMPVLLLVIAVFVMSFLQPIHRRGVLSYATSVNAGGLLDATNTQRGQNGASALKLSSSLSAAAQAKANDMVARNYWSHTTPDGQQPWVFVDKTGYKYQKAGENLAYGFLTSNETVSGWMNSPSHKSNMLDTAYSEVGFGYANSVNFNNDGEQTVVVAMYAQPQVLAASNQQATATPTPSPVATPTPTPAPAALSETPEEPEPETATPVTSQAVIAEPTSTAVTRVQTLLSGEATWAVLGVGIITGLAATMLLIKHAAGLRHLIRDSERFVLHHPLLDTVLVSVVALGSFLSQTTGVIR